MRHRQVMHTPVSTVQLSCHECKVPPSFSLLSCLQTPLPPCSALKAKPALSLWFNSVIPSLPSCPGTVAAVLPQLNPAGPCSSCHHTHVPKDSCHSTSGDSPGHQHKCGSAVVPWWQQGPARCSQVHSKHCRMFNQHKSLPLVVSAHSAVNVASAQVCVIHSLLCFDLTEALPESRAGVLLLQWALLLGVLRGCPSNKPAGLSPPKGLPEIWDKNQSP